MSPPPSPPLRVNTAPTPTLHSGYGLNTPRYAALRVHVSSGSTMTDVRDGPMLRVGTWCLLAIWTPCGCLNAHAVVQRCP